MSLVDQKYNEHLENLTGQQRLERTVSLFGSICAMITLQVKEEFPGASDRELRRKVAERLYMSDKATLKLLRMVPQS